MAKNYPFSEIEPKWQNAWDQEGVYRAKNPPVTNSEKFYALVEFPYPSGDGLHVGHPRSYTALDIISRKKRMQGFNVVYPMGWDAFGLPTENAAIKKKMHPTIITAKNIATFKRQMQSLGTSFDWSREINTTDPGYYRWTQWMFVQFYNSYFDKNLNKAQSIDKLQIPAEVQSQGEPAIKKYIDSQRMAYKTKTTINWCPSCKIGLANEEAQGGVCERCGGPVEKREKEQWMIRITKYADRLIDELADVDYLDKIKTQQINWIGRSAGARIKFQVTNFKSQITEASGINKNNEIPAGTLSLVIGNSSFAIEVFTTRPDTLFGATYLVLSPEHELIAKWMEEGMLTNVDEIKSYRETARKKTDIERQENKEKTGVRLEGVTAVNPATQKEIPIYIADYVLAGYGTGAIMAVPAHDERDYEFAKKFELPIVRVLAPDIKMSFQYKSLALIESSLIAGLDCSEDNGTINIAIKAWDQLEKALNLQRKLGVSGINIYDKKNDDLILRNFIEAFDNNTLKDQIFTGRGIAVNSGFLDGLTTEEATKKIITWLEENNYGRAEVNYKQRDWVFSRQRYWGEPIPMIHCGKCGWNPVPEKDLPVLLPEVENYEPTDSGESPLSAITDWVKTVCPICGIEAKRETDTMPNWAGSSWYFLRYCDPQNDQVFASPKALEYWMPVNLYDGGMEHTTLHLLYSRFWYKFLHDLGHVPAVCGNEPYAKRTAHGMILGEGGVKMSKSKGNVINPDEVIAEYGSDVFRCYEMFMGPFDTDAPWDTHGIQGVKRFLDKVWTLFESQKTRDDLDLVRGTYCSLLHKSIKKVGEDIDSMRFNTAISQLMIMTNELSGLQEIAKEDFESYIKILAPFAPHLAEEIWHKLGHETSVHLESWPKYKPDLLQDEIVTIAVQVNGKLRAQIAVTPDASESEVREAAINETNVQKHLAGNDPKKIIYIPGKILNIVI